ncbi:hypothetical protein, partial [Mesorhizobium japonicum]|uniref:hypothetical protein n=1 Tax=Mesorhizobium japonicum TaxID=2066070 RepID=UPI003B5C5AD9
VERWGADALRVRAVHGGEIADTDFALLPSSGAAAEVVVDGDVARITAGRITATLTARAFDDWTTGYRVSRCRIDFADASGRPLLRELDEGGSLELRAREYRPILGTAAARLTASFESPADERIVGMGLYQQTLIDLKG